MQLVYNKSSQNPQIAATSARAAALLFDCLLLSAIIGFVDYVTISSDESALFLKPERVLHLLFGWLYFAGAESAPWQATIGKYLLGLKVTSISGGRISFTCATIRYFTRPFTLVAWLFRLLLTAPAYLSRALHDSLSSTRVVAL
ncbi:RDD family protein [Pontibacter qinzhouensis]|uniref:RDD family protein n=1 Tax=Pontibacter qinzhouensis TaxID=2603253 RepID=A0A5C8JKT8_9BACT|nr:RDD family protein [Pontibacter qinzhouensis]TXK37656.1 RDD family protein [Pontibacter qinzhouensis]